jgi:hypothetical protein
VCSLIPELKMIETETDPRTGARVVCDSRYNKLVE